MIASAFIDGVLHWICEIDGGMFQVRKDNGKGYGWDTIYTGPRMMCDAVLDNLCDNANEWE